jgi:hypothetical protein
MDMERQQLISKASSTSSNNSGAASAKLEKCLVSQQRHALLPSDVERKNM